MSEIGWWVGVLGAFKRHVEARSRSARDRNHNHKPTRKGRSMATPAVAWFEVTGKDGKALQQFYGRLFDWPIQDSGDGSGYGLVSAAENGIGGGIGRAQDGGPGMVTFYVEVDDPATYLEKAEQLGGQTIMPPSTLEDFGLTIAFFSDIEGHVIGLSKGAVRR